MNEFEKAVLTMREAQRAEKEAWKKAKKSRVNEDFEEAYAAGGKARFTERPVDSSLRKIQGGGQS